MMLKGCINCIGGSDGDNNSTVIETQGQVDESLNEEEREVLSKEKEEKRAEVLASGEFDSLKNLQVGETFYFGTYEQSYDVSNQKEKIEWRVLDRQGERILVLSEKILDSEIYEDSSMISWGKSVHRTWLRENIYEKAFSEEEQSLIAQTELLTVNEYQARHEETTFDYVFALSKEDVEQYLIYKEQRIGYATEYAEERGADSRWSSSCEWFLRNPYGGSGQINIVDEEGKLDTAYSWSDDPVNYRPAMWLSFESSELSEVKMNQNKETMYMEAVELEVSGDFEGAIDRFVSLGDYKDCAERLQSTVEKINAQKDDARKLLLPDGKYEVLKQAQIGDLITLGTFEQDADLENGAEPIEWLVLAKEENRMLVVSKYLLYARAAGNMRVTNWTDSPIREWMNGTFYEKAFSEEEKFLVVDSIVQTENRYEELPDEITVDQVFSLSKREAEQYFSDNDSRIAEVTPYTKKLGEDGGFQVGGDDHNECMWILRTPCGPELEPERMWIVWPNGGFFEGYFYEHSDVDYRPAMWISIGE